jgi:hypothetical protein
MDRNITALERAFQLARSGDCETIDKLKAKLRDEGFDQWVLVGPSLMNRLGTLMRNHHRKDPA